MAKITLNGVDALTESGGVVTIPAAANLNLGTDSVPSAAIQDDAVTGAKIENNPTIAGNLTVTGLSTLTGNTTIPGDFTVTGISTLTGNTIVTGNLTVNGTTITVNAETLTIDDKNIEMGSIASPTDTTADGGGITLKGTTDKTILWENDTDSWNFSEHIETATNKKIKSKGEAIMHSLHRSWVLGG